jgi:hypothetical protein
MQGRSSHTGVVSGASLNNPHGVILLIMNSPLRLRNLEAVFPDISESGTERVRLRLGNQRPIR